MARTDNLTNFLTDVADSIREKKGTSEPILASNFDTEIAGIETGVIPTGTLDITTNGEYNVTNYARANVFIEGGTNEYEFTGSYDRDGLKQLGWTDEEVDYYNENGVDWNKENNKYYVLTDKDFGTVSSSTTRFLPKNSTETSFTNYYYLKAIPVIDISSKTSLLNIFNTCYSLTTIPLLDTSNATNMQAMFSSCYALKKVPDLNTTKVTNMKSMFSNCHSLRKAPQIDTSKATDMTTMFSYCYSLIEVPQLDTSSATTLSSVFEKCYSLIKTPNIDASSCTTLSKMCQECYSLVGASFSNTGNVTNFNRLFYSCYSLKKVTGLDTSSATNVADMFGYCSVLETLPELNFESVVNLSSMLTGTTVLRNLGGFKNLGKAYLTTQSANYSNYTLSVSAANDLTHESLMNIINNLYDIASAGVQTQQLKIGSTNLAKLTAEEIAIATNKGWVVS